MATSNFPVVYKHLRAILEPYDARLTVSTDTGDSYSLDGPYSEKWKKVIFFGARR